MLTIIHGDDTSASRTYYLSEREKYPEKVILDGATLSLTDFLQATSGNGLFGDQQTIFIEDLFSKRKPSKELDAIQLSIVNSQSSIYLWESKELTKKQLQQFNNTIVKQFSIPRIVFSFLDALLPNNSKKLITLFHELLKNEDVNFVLFMLQRQFRILLALHSVILGSEATPEPDRSRSSQDDISEVNRMAPWQKGKLQKQAKTFTQSQLLSSHEALYTLELGQKTGTLPQTLQQAIDFFLLTL